MLTQQYFMRHLWPIWEMSSHLKTWLQKILRNMSDIIVSTVPADGLAPLDSIVCTYSDGYVCVPYSVGLIASIGKTPVRIILWCPITKMLIKACFLVQPLEQEGVCQKCCISMCSKVFINYFYQMKASPECLNILTYCSEYWVDRLRRTIGRKV